jgi:hypothetical protein
MTDGGRSSATVEEGSSAVLNFPTLIKVSG